MTQSLQGERRMLIDGKLVDARSGATFNNLNPATEEVLGPVADGGVEDMRQAIVAARTAFDTTDWANNRALRKRCLIQLQEAIESEREDIRAELVGEVGTPVQMTSHFQLDGPLADALLWPAQMIDDYEWERSLPPGQLMGIASRRSVVKEPIGVVGAIVPWNFPFEVSLSKIGQILATGNTMVLKPAPDTPWNATRLGRLVNGQTDIPQGVFNVVTSSDHLVGEELTLSPLVDMISFTGSTATGKRIMERGAATLKRVFLELGGKSAAIILDDADFATALQMTAFGACMHAGQGCALQTRVLLPRARYDEGVAILAAAMEAGLAEDARVVVGGGRPEHLDRGFYVEPTLFADVDSAMAIAQREIFGPVLCALRYDSDDDAVRIANDSDYGLSGGVWSADEKRATQVALRIRTGCIGINGALWYGADSPFGGFKMSGIGRQNGREGFEQHLESKAVAWPAVS
jgi:aldehyde dehydrogenase (NAD+)